MELRGKYTLFAEGARGSLSKMHDSSKFNLHEGRDPQKYGIGLKEIWQVESGEQHHEPGLHPAHLWLASRHVKTGGGSFLYHITSDNQRRRGLCRTPQLFENPTLSPFDEFQRFKTHPVDRGDASKAASASPMAHARSRKAAGSRCRASTVPGGVLIGCAAGFVNVPRIKGSHNAILLRDARGGRGRRSKRLKARARAPHARGRCDRKLAGAPGPDREAICERVRNVKPLWSRFGTLGGVMLGGLDMWTNSLAGFSFFGTLKHGKADYQTLQPLSAVTPLTYPKPDGKLTFDKPSSVYLSSTTHEENQPPHLKLTDPSIPIDKNLPEYGEPARLYCPAGVYEVVYADEAAKTDPRFVINAQNCVHCKTCDIKDPAQNITWVPPEGSGGPNYSGM